MAVADDAIDRCLDLRREFGVVVTYPLPNPLPYQLRKLSHLERFFLVAMPGRS